MARKEEKEEKQTHPDASRTIDEFCALENISRFSYYKMRKNKHGPKELHIPGSEIVRITAEAHAEWRERMQELAVTKAGKLENARRVAQRKLAGKRSVELAKRGERVA